MSETDLIRQILDLQAVVRRIECREVQRWVYLSTPLTSTSWDGDAYSTTAKTPIDLSAVFGVPAGVKAVLVRISCRDSGSAATSGLFVGFDPTNAAQLALAVRPSGLPNDWFADGAGIVPCDANGDVYVQIQASGAATMDVYIYIYGYQL